MDRRYRQLPERVKVAFERLHDQAQTQPREAIPELLKWIEEYPDMPLLYNYLGAAYSNSDQLEKAEAMILENYRRNPDYLFARLNYAELCLVRRDYDKVEEIFESKYDLKALYPERTRFHISEVASFMGVVGLYFLEIGKRENAEKYYEILQEIAPDYPVVDKLRARLLENRLQRAFRVLTGLLAEQPEEDSTQPDAC